MNLAAAIPEKHGGDRADRSAVRLWLRLLRSTMAVEKIVRRRLANDFATTLPRFDLLAAVERRPDGVTMGELSKALMVSNGNVTGIVRTLAGEGLLSVAPDAADRRVLVVTMTARGRTEFAEQAAAHHAWIEALFAGFAPADREQLYALLGSLKTSIGAGREEES